MKQRTGLMNLFWTVLASVIIVLVVLGGCVAWRLVHSTTPKIERSHMDPEQLLERTAIARQEETSDTTVGKNAEVRKGNVVTSAKDDEDEFEGDEEEYYDDEYEEDETEEDVKDENQQEFSYTLEDVAVPVQSPRPAVTKAKAAPKKSTAPKIIYASYKQGLVQCQKGSVIPCSWKDNTGPLIKQYWLRSSQGPIERIMYTRNGKMVSQTFVGLDNVVTRYQGDFAELYFEDGLLTKIRTFPYENPNLRDWFLINKQGKIAACLCGVPTADCCSRSFLYREGGPRRYCDLFPLDADFCSK